MLKLCVYYRPLELTLKGGEGMSDNSRSDGNWSNRLRNRSGKELVRNPDFVYEEDDKSESGAKEKDSF